MDDIVNKFENALNDENGFFIKIRNLEGVDEEKLQDILLILREIKEFYSQKNLVPKYLVLLIMDMEPILWGMLDSYSNPIKDQILLAIDKISIALKDCFR